MSDKRAEEIIGILLRTGVTIAALSSSPPQFPTSSSTAPPNPTITPFTASPITSATSPASSKPASLSHPAAIIQLGILILIATPVARVAFSVFAFAEERDWMYVIVTLIVLALLLFSLSATNL